MKLLQKRSTVPLLLLVLVVVTAEAYLQPLVLFNGTLGSGVAIKSTTSRARCGIIQDPHAPVGSKVLQFTTSTFVASPNYCGLFFTAPRDLRGYTELAFWLRSTSDYVTLSAASSSGNGNPGDGVPLTVDNTWKQYRFPLPDTFVGVDFASALSAFLLKMQLGTGEEVRIAQVQLLSRGFFPIFSDETYPGRYEIQPGGATSCQFLSNAKVAKEGKYYLRVSPTTFSCYFFYMVPSFDLRGTSAGVRFWLKSSEPTQAVIKAMDTYYATVPSTGGVWKRITLPMSQFGIRDTASILSEVPVPFGIQRVGGQGNQEILVDDVEYYS